MNFLKDYICVDKFKDICDVVYNKNIEKVYQKNCVIFSDDYSVNNIFNIINKSNYKHILITIDDNICVDKIRYDFKPKNIIYWFSNNINCKRKNLIPIPVGIKNNNYNFKLINNMFKYNKKYFNLIYNNVDNLTNEEIIYNVYNNEYVKFNENLNSYKVWECIYLGTIPIVKRNFINSCFKKLPILMVDNINDININILKKSLLLFKNINAIVINYPELKFTYWKKYIDNCKELL